MPASGGKYCILIEFGIPMKLVRPIKMRLNLIYNKVRTGKHMSGTFPIRNGQYQEVLCRHCFSTLL
jgi:hypothetical protein